MNYYIADLHLGHENIIRLQGRPFESVEEMDEALVRNWNVTVKGCDTVYIAGDLIYKSAEPEKYLSELKGKKVLIKGNHDEGWLKKADPEKYFVKVVDIAVENIENRVVTMCHYPMLEWKNSRKEGSKKLGFLVHGHIHARTDTEEYKTLFTLPHALNAGADITGFRPVTFRELYEINLKFKHKALRGTPRDEVLSEREKGIKI